MLLLPLFFFFFFFVWVCAETVLKIGGYGTIGYLFLF